MEYIEIIIVAFIVFFPILFLLTIQLLVYLFPVKPNGYDSWIRNAKLFHKSRKNNKIK